MAIQNRKAELRELCRQGRYSEALALGAALCRQSPGDPELWFLTGAVHGAVGTYDQAEQCCRKALALAPDQVPLLYNLGIALLRQNRGADAEPILLRAQVLQPGHAGIATALADSALQQTKYEWAVRLFQQSLALEPRQPQALHNLAHAQQQLGRFAEAEQSYRKAAALAPKLAETYLGWSRMLIGQGEFARALQVVEAGLAHLPSHTDLLYQHGFLLAEGGRPEAALTRFESCLTTDPGHVEARFARATILRHAGRLTEAAGDLHWLIEADARNARAHAGLSGLLRDEGRIEAMLQHDQQAIELDPANPELQHHRLMDLHYSERISPQELFTAHREWGERYGAVPQARTRHVNDRDPARVLRIGYVSADFKRHSVAHFIAPVLAHHDRGGFLVYCYSSLHPDRHDAMTGQLRASADLWRDVASLSDADLATLIAADGIDILVDLSGHTGGNRLGAFALRPAPVQLNWLGYPDTTGLPTMDYRLTDAWADPPGSADDRATETLLRLTEGFLCYAPPPDAPACAAPPHQHYGFMTFGSFNNLAKMNDTVIACWSAILRAVPDSRLLLKGAALADVDVRARVAGRFAAQGIEAARLDLLAYTGSTTDHLACYQRMDIALDTFPYNGTTTTCEALWMGVPVVMQVGQIHASRTGLSLLQQVGLADYAAASVEDYVARAVALANDVQRLTALHASLRERMRNAPLMDGAGFCARLERDGYRRVWRQWCEATD